MCGPHWARWLIMANKSASADMAFTMGLVHQVFPDESFEDEVMAFCRHLAKQNGEQMGAAKIAIELSSEVGRDMGRHVERMANSALMLNPDYVTGDGGIPQGRRWQGQGQRLSLKRRRERRLDRVPAIAASVFEQRGGVVGLRSEKSFKGDVIPSEALKIVRGAVTPRTTCSTQRSSGRPPARQAAAWVRPVGQASILSSVYSSIPSTPHSRPMPLAL